MARVHCQGPDGDFISNRLRPVSTDLDETWLEVGVGGSRQVSSPTSVPGNIGFSTTFDGNNYAWNGKVGLRMSWELPRYRSNGATLDRFTAGAMRRTRGSRRTCNETS